NQPELTAEKFVLNPFMAGERLYRTGDRARYLPNGHIEFIERMDNQVKIRGYRVELGEVESALNQHPAVRESVTVIRDRGSSGDKELVAYVVPQVPSALSVTELRNFLEQKLPQYMIPSGFVTLEALPRNPNGKVDRNALPPDSQRPLLDQGFVEPRTEIEELVARVWREVLKLKEVGVYDNFFKLGGHSLLATRVISRIRDLFHIDMPLRTVFQAPTIVGLAQAVVTAQQKGLQVVRTPILPVGREKPVLPSVAQEPLLGLERLFPGAYCFNIPAAYRLKGVLDVNALKRSLNAVVERHEALRTTFPTVSGRQVQFIVSSLSITLEVVDLERLPELQRESEAKRLAREEVETPFDLAAGPLLRVKLLKLNDRDHVILVTMHHIISDGWSMIIFFRDLAQFYEASLNGHDPSLPELPIQYADFSEWQRQALEGQLMKNQLVYWKQQLDRPLSRFEFSTGRPRMAELSFLAARKSLSITGDLVQSLKKLSQREEGTLFTTLLTALKVLLYFCTGEKDIRVGTLVENRNRRETENLIGHFANTLIIRSKVSPSSNFRQLAREVRDITLAAQAHQDLPFEVLAQAWESDKNLDRASLCQTVFIYQTSPLYPIKLPGLTVDLLDDIKRVEEPEIAITTFDLILAMKEKPAGIVGSLIYKVDVLDEAVINRTIAHFYTILRRVISKPNQPVSELCRLEKTQR
ncbi:MAG TPA: condensation domain-containing protein, partial [Candidatus Binatia bacterium]|nr:condensation domain-containing protein [Candidatus Binatia bacterium]